MVRSGGARQAVGKINRVLDGKGVEGGRKVGRAQEDTRKGKSDTPKALDVRILLRRVRTCEALLDLAGIKKFTKVVRDKSGALIGAHDGRLEGVRELHLGGEVRREVLERGGGNDGGGAVARV